MSCNEGPDKWRSDEIIALLHENDTLRVRCAGLENQFAAEKASNYDLSLMCEDLRKEASEMKENLSVWQKRCMDAEDRLNFTEAGHDIRQWENAQAERDALREENKWLRRELDFAHAQLEIVFRIFPERSSCSGV